jgi:hypothetical protein
MRASELLGSEVVDTTGSPMGVVRDVLLDGDDDGRPPPGSEHHPVAGLVVSRSSSTVSAWCHRWGLATDRVGGPLLLRLLGRSARRSTCFVPWQSVSSWGPGKVVADRTHVRTLSEVGR